MMAVVMMGMYRLRRGGLSPGRERPRERTAGRDARCCQSDPSLMVTAGRGRTGVWLLGGTGRGMCRPELSYIVGLDQEKRQEIFPQRCTGARRDGRRSAGCRWS